MEYKWGVKVVIIIITLSDIDPAGVRRILCSLPFWRPQDFSAKGYKFAYPFYGTAGPMKW